MRAKILRVSASFLAHLCAPGISIAECVENTLPMDVTVRMCATDPRWPLDVFLVVEHHSFEDIPKSQPLPEMPVPTFQQRRLVRVPENDFNADPATWGMWREEEVIQ